MCTIRKLCIIKQQIFLINLIAGNFNKYRIVSFSCENLNYFIFLSCTLGQESTTDCSNSRRYWKSIGREIEPIASSLFPTRIAANAAIFATSRKQWQRCCCSSYWGWWAWNWGSRFQPCTIASSNAATANLLIASSSKWLF